MHFDIFKRRADAHLRSVQQYLQEANLARIEHQVAAEHHAALAAMYTQRVTWLEQEMTNPCVPWPAQAATANKQIEANRRGLAAVLSWPRPKVLDGSLPESA